VRKRCSTSTVGRPILVATRPEAEWLPFVATIAEGYAIAALSESPSAAIGQVSADGQFRWDGAQWVPIPRAFATDVVDPAPAAGDGRRAAGAGRVHGGEHP
jgi:hypothetical protein